MVGNRGKKLTPERVKQIIQIIENLVGVVSWQRVVESIERTLLIHYTRQGLASHQAIRGAYRAAVQRSEREATNGTTTRRARRDARVDRYKADNDRLSRENQRLMNMHITWLYNAYLHGLSEEQLNKPIPPVNRGQTR